MIGKAAALLCARKERVRKMESVCACVRVRVVCPSFIETYKRDLQKRPIKDGECVCVF